MTFKDKISKLKLKQFIVNKNQRLLKDTIINIYTHISARKNKYLKENLDSIIKPYYKGEVERSSKKINIEKNAMNEYSLIDKDITSDIMNNLKNIHHESIEILLKRLLPYVHLNENSVNFDDFIILDVLTGKGSIFPSFHTDIEWASFNAHDGFQVWILLEDDPEIKPRGNMFIMETDIVERGLNMVIQKDSVNISKQKMLKKNELLHSFKNLNELDPKIKYLNANIGDVFIMNSKVFHCSDTKNIFSNRKAVSIRFIHKPTEILKIGNLSNNYSKTLCTIHPYKKNGEYYEYNFNNKDNNFAFM